MSGVGKTQVPRNFLMRADKLAAEGLIRKKGVDKYFINKINILIRFGWITSKWSVFNQD